MRPASWHSLLVRPFVAQWPVIFASTASCFLIQLVSGWATRWLWKEGWRQLEKNGATDEYCVRHVSTVHCLAAWTVIPSFFLLPAAVTENAYGYDAWTQTVISISVGYFIWDFLVCLYYRWGPAFLSHCICCLSVMYAALYPFLQQDGRFYLGFFEMSTPFLNLYKQAELCGHPNSRLAALFGVLFAVTFSVVRIFVGVPYSVGWWFRMHALWKSGLVHSYGVLVMYGVFNLLLNGLNLLWWTALLRQAFARPKNPSPP